VSAPRPRRDARAPTPRGGARARRTVPPDSPRRVALDALVRVDEGAYSNLDLPQRLRRSRLATNDRAWVTDAVYGTLRAQGRIDALLAPHSTRPLVTLDSPVRAALRLGAYQLLHDVPAHAAVGETVSAAPPSGRGYVNAVHRSVARTGPPFAEPTDLATRLSYPNWIVDELTSRVGATEAEAALCAMNEPPAVTLRVNRRRAESDALAGELARGGVDVAPGRLVSGALRVRATGDLAALRAVRDGRATPQDEASQAVADAVDAGPGMRILDVAAAPGGKTTALAEAMDGTGLVVGHDVARGRLQLVREAAGRLRLDNVEVVAGDGTRPAFRPASFDAVLVDAPCSGLGVLRRRAEARWRVQPADVAELAALQRELLRAACELVRPGGRLVYSVCTLSAAETVGVDAWLASELPQLQTLEPPGAPWRPDGRGALLLPQDVGTDGMFLLVLQHTA
jgi:16S rRNA (cytosine967-C5)-methyltransferase